MKRDRHTRPSRKANAAPVALGLILTGGVIMIATLGYLALNLDRTDTLAPICIPFAAAGIVLAFTGAAMMLFSRRNPRRNRRNHSKS